MNDQHHDQPDQPDETPAPLPEPDAFEQRWMRLLGPAEPGQADEAPAEDAEAFVAGVMDRYDAMQCDAETRTDHAVAGRIGRASLAYAAAAAVLLVALIGGYAFITGQASGPDPADQLATPGPYPSTGKNNAEQQKSPPPQPDPSPRVVRGDKPKVELGQLITKTQALATQTDPDLIKTLNQTRQTLDLSNLLEIVSRPLPDLQQLLAPLKQDDQQSRA